MPGSRQTASTISLREGHTGTPDIGFHQGTSSRNGILVSHRPNLKAGTSPRRREPPGG